MLLVKPNLNVLPKAAAVVIPCCLGIPKGLHETHIWINNLYKAMILAHFPALANVKNVTSMMGLEARTRSSTLASPEEELTVAK